MCIRDRGAPAWKAPFVSAETDDSYKNVSKGTYVRGTFEIKKDIKEAYAFTTAPVSYTHLFFVKMLQIICGLRRYCKEIILSGNSLVHTRCCKHMTEIINLKIIDIAHS